MIFAAFSAEIASDQAESVVGAHRAESTRPMDSCEWNYDEKSTTFQWFNFLVQVRGED